MAKQGSGSNTGKTPYLWQRGSTWYVRVPVPRPLRKHFGDVRLVRSLRTDSLAEANDLKWPVVAELKARIREAKRAANGLPPSLLDEAKRMRAALLKAPDDEQVLWTIEARLQALADKHAKPQDATDLHHEPPLPPQVADMAQLVLGGATLEEASDAWLRSAAKANTKDARESVLKAFASAMGKGLDQIVVETVTRREALRAVEAWEQAGLASATIRQRVATLSALWNAMGARAERPMPNPWQGIKPLKKNHQGKRAEKHPFTVEQAIAAITPRLNTSAELRDCVMFALGFLTGARASELYAVQAVEEGEGTSWFEVSSDNAKTKSSRRRIPVTSEEGRALLRLWPRLPRIDLRSQSSRCTEHLQVRKLPASVDFHSTRRTFINLGERAGADPLALQRFVGHRPAGMSFTVYSRSGSDAALEGVSKTVTEAYGGEFAAALRSLVARVSMQADA